jgi:uncharacterized caspase-like protein/TPR repeat protein
MQTFLRPVLLALTVFWLALAPSQAEARRAAIIVGNSSYDWAPLTNPRNDASLIAKILADLDFDVRLIQDFGTADLPALKQTVADHFKGAEIGLFFYAGHGLQYRGENLLLPIDLPRRSTKEIVANAFKLSDLLSAISTDTSGVRIIALDACRENPLQKAGTDFEQGLAYTEAKSGEVLIAFATRAGDVAYDGGAVANSPYSAALAQSLQQPNLDVYDVFRNVRKQVRLTTNGLQIPWVTGSVETRYVFRKEEAPDATLVAAAQDGLTIDAVLWHFISASADPADFSAFVEAFPQSPHAAEARQRGQQVMARIETESVTRGTGGAIGASAAGRQAAAGPGDTFVFPMGGTRAMSETLREWPKVMPPVPEGLGAVVSQCDILAADPDDPQRLVPGVSWGLVNVRDAVRACVLDLARRPNDARLQFQLGRVLDIANMHDWAAAFYERSGAQNYTAALVNHGYMFRTGRGRPVDFQKARELYRRAADLGNLRARTNIGSLYINGEGVEKSYAEGILWYRLAGSSGWANAITALGDAYRRGFGVRENPSEAVRLYMMAAENGQADAMVNIGRAYANGWGVARDLGQAVSWYEKADDLGNQYAPFYLGQIFADGKKPIKADKARALSLLTLSAERGFNEAHLEPAKRYANGSLGKKDPRRAYYHVRLAASTGVKEAKEVVDSFAAPLSEADRSAVDEEVRRFIQQNGP